jgi:hypothetical protein
MKPLPPLGECINRLHSHIELHHGAAQVLFKTHKQSTACQIFVAAVHRSISLVTRLLHRHP